MRQQHRLRQVFVSVLATVGLIATSGGPAGAHPDPGDGHVDNGGLDAHHEDPSAALAARDVSTASVISDGPFARITKNLDLVGRGERNVEDATTDVFAMDGFAYTGTFDSPCGGDPEAGIWVWDVEDPSKPGFVTVIPSPTGSRSNDVKVARMGAGDILVHSNEACAEGGPGGFEIYNVDDPANPVFLAHVQIDEIAEITPQFFAPGALDDVGVHNLFLFTQGDRDYVAAQSEGVFDGFRIYEITDPTDPVLVSGWGAEEVFDPGVGDLTLADDPTGARTLDSVLWLLGLPPFAGFGASQNRLLHDFTITTDGTLAYLAHWDAGLILMDISDPANPQYISTALDPVNGSLDGEVNSHSVWPSEDGTTVVEGEEDFSVFESEIPPTNLGLQFLNTIPGVAVSTSAGDAFEANQTGNSGTVTATSVEVASGPLTGQSFDAVEFGENNVPLGDGSVSGDFVWVGRACNGDPFENPVSPGDIAVVRRGECFFSDKEANVAAAGAAAMVLGNNQQDSVWSGLRIWDYSDPSNPVLASTFNTTCSADPEAQGCDRDGTYSAHNVQVESRGNKTFAYVSWYWDGMLVLDVTDPYNPVEVSRYLDRTGPNDGLANDFWGVYKEHESPFIYGSDRNGGLYVFKQKGSGTG
jgi:hypothetical protein